jgi:hypothetical protein
MQGIDRPPLTSGNPDAMLAAWSRSFARVPYPDTMVPLITATALAANGHVARARAALERAQPGPAWDAALEQRLLVETLLDAFDGDRDEAVMKAARLRTLPLPPYRPQVQRHVQLLREALRALARAFVRRAEPDDVDLLEQAARMNPLMFWALRYAAAVAAIDLKHPEQARKLLKDAPSWSADSIFHEFDAEIRSHLRVENATIEGSRHE